MPSDSSASRALSSSTALTRVASGRSFFVLNMSRLLNHAPGMDGPAPIPPGALPSPAYATSRRAEALPAGGGRNGGPSGQGDPQGQGAVAEQRLGGQRGDQEGGELPAAARAGE